MLKKSLNGKWNLSIMNSEHALHGQVFSCMLPGDIHSTLIENKIIPDPYVGTKELDIQWVGQQDWRLSRKFDVTKEELELNAVMSLTNVDTFSNLYINGKNVLYTNNQFKRYIIDVSENLVVGENEIVFEFISASKIAIEENAKLEYPIPTTLAPVVSPHRNLVRKTQCHSGWDWGPCIMVSGVYDDIEIKFVKEGYLEDFILNTIKEDDKWYLDVKLNCFSYVDGQTSLNLSVANEVYKDTVKLTQGLNTINFKFEVKDVKEWYPLGYGDANLYEVKLDFLANVEVKKVGFRTLVVKCEKDKDGSGLAFCVNGIDIFAKGTNWIPVDALPSRMTDDVYIRLLNDTKAANMNMIRVWGGGMYEKEIFYNLCDELGILIWHDMMFSCSMYPAGKEFLDNVDAEMKYQIKRLQSHACIALWCGNNEDLGAFSWYEETKANPIRYVVDYDRLNEGIIGKNVKELDPGRKWWPSSPCAGEGVYTDNWHDDGSGDMHFWSVWHEGKGFEEYYTINPRFVSEFGYQSFPSLSSVTEYSEGDFNLTGKALEHHQKSPKGNSIIIENFTRYYRFPTSFAKMLYLSQVQQAEAMKLGVCHFRSLMPHCMGSIIWQLNDNWPVCSWASIEYSGKWKLLHYSAKKFYQDIMVMIKKIDNKIELFVVNDTLSSYKDKLHFFVMNFALTKVKESIIDIDIPKQTSSSILKLDESQFDVENQFLFAKIANSEDVCLLTKPKKCNIKRADIKYKLKETAEGILISLTTNYPTFNVALDTDCKGVFSDNNFTMFETKEVLFKGDNLNLANFRKTFTVYDLSSVGEY